MLWKFDEVPNKAFIHVLKKKVGAIKYNSVIMNKHSAGNKSNKNEKNKISETNIMDPGKPRKMSKLTKLTKKSLGHKKFTPLISVIRRVLNLRAIASTSRNELVDKRAWLISIQKPDKISEDCPLTTHSVNQCISTTVE